MNEKNVSQIKLWLLPFLADQKKYISRPVISTKKRPEEDIALRDPDASVTDLGC